MYICYYTTNQIKRAVFGAGYLLILDINRYIQKNELKFTPDFPTGRIADNQNIKIWFQNLNLGKFKYQGISNPLYGKNYS
jgi:hypothetical protein